jgi:hypothetical protein
MEGEGEGEGSFSPLSTSPQATLFRPLSFSFDIKVLFYHGSRLLFMHFFIFPWPINYNHAFLMLHVPHTFIVDSFWLKIYSIVLEIMVSHMATSYGPQVTQVNEESAPKSSLDLTLTQHPCDEDPEP